MAKKKGIEIWIETVAKTRGIRLIKRELQGLVRIGKASSSVFGGMFKGLKKGMNIVRSTASLAVIPVKALGAAVIGLSATILGLSGVAVSSSGNIESLKIRLEGAMASAQDAKRAFDETFALFVRSPMNLEPLVEARILLEGLGIKGAKALTSVAQAAAIMSRPVEDVARMLGSMETEPLRGLGIQLRREADKFTFTFRDKMGNVREIMAETRDAAQQQLLKIFDIKFGGSLQKLSATWKGVMSTLTGATSAAFAELGDGLREVLTGVVAGANDQIIDLIESGTLQRLGQRIGKLAESVVKASKVAADKAYSTYAGLKKLYETDRDKFYSLLVGSMQKLGGILVDTIIQYLLASIDVFVGISKVMAAAFKAEINLMILKMPKGLFGNEKKAIVAQAREQMKNLSGEDRQELGKKYGVDPGLLYTAMATKKGRGMAAEVAARSGRNDLSNAISAVPQNLRERGVGLRERASETLSSLKGDFTSSGVTFDKSIPKPKPLDRSRAIALQAKREKLEELKAEEEKKGSVDTAAATRRAQIEQSEASAAASAAANFAAQRTAEVDGHRVSNKSFSFRNRARELEAIAASERKEADEAMAIVSRVGEHYGQTLATMVARMKELDDQIQQANQQIKSGNRR